MRPTLLAFRSPQERTAEFKSFEIDRSGNNLNFVQKVGNKTGSNLPKEKRFKDPTFFSKGSGASSFLGPGSYNDHESFLHLNKSSCPSKIVSSPSNYL